MSRTGALVWFILPNLLSGTALAETYCVSPTGSDQASGQCDAPWATLQHAADSVQAGDTVMVRAGNYQGFNLTTSGESGSPITFQADADVVIDQNNPSTTDGINLEGAAEVVVEGFTVTGTSRAGIRAVQCSQVTIRNNRTDQNATWGIFTGFCDDLLIEGNQCSRSAAQHGIYVSNSSHRPVIRGNLVWGNGACGIHMNGDASQGGDGLVSEALVEGNTIYDNGAKGGSGINGDGVQNAIIRNNLLYGNHASGISLYRTDAAQAATENLIINNTVIMASDGRWALNIQNASTGNQALNNILLNLNTSNGSMDVSSDSFPLTSDYNIVEDSFNSDTTRRNLDQWRAATGLDSHSSTAGSSELFSNAANDDYHLRKGSPAIDKGTSTSAPSQDLDGNARPSGSGVDIGAYEYVVTGGTGSGGNAVSAVSGSAGMFSRGGTVSGAQGGVMSTGGTAAASGISGGSPGSGGQSSLGAAGHLSSGGSAASAGTDAGVFGGRKPAAGGSPVATLTGGAPYGGPITTVSSGASGGTALADSSGGALLGMTVAGGTAPGARASSAGAALSAGSTGQFPASGGRSSLGGTTARGGSSTTAGGTSGVGGSRTAQGGIPSAGNTDREASQDTGNCGCQVPGHNSNPKLAWVFLGLASLVLLRKGRGRSCRQA